MSFLVPELVTKDDRHAHSRPVPSRAMITLYRPPNDAWSDEVQEALDEMVIAYETEFITNEADRPDDVPELPAVRDDDAIITGEAALREHLDHLRALMADWDRFQSDACYIDDDGTIC